MLCLGLKKDGTLCDRKATKKTGYCPEHSPKEEPKQLPAVLAAAAIIPIADEQKRREVERCNFEGSVAEATVYVEKIEDVETLRAAEKSILVGLINGTIDSKSGSAIVQLLKHQAELLEIQKPKEGTLDAVQKQRVIDKAKAMSADEGWALLQNFTSNLKKLVKTVAQETQEESAPIEATEVQVVETKEVKDEPGQTTTDNEVCQRDAGVSTAAAEPREVF